MKVVVIPQMNHKGEDIEDPMLLGRGLIRSKVSNRGRKNISFLTYDGTFGATKKVLAFIQQFDVAFGDEDFTKSSKLQHVAMHFQKSTKQWWASLWANGEDPKTWKDLRASIVKQFLASNAKDKVLIEWKSLKLSLYESIHKYVKKFWDLHLKSIVYKMIDFEEQKQQFCAGLFENMKKYVNSQRPKSILAIIHHTTVAARINFQQGAKKNLKPMEMREKHEPKGKDNPQNSSKGSSSNNKLKRRESTKLPQLPLLLFVFFLTCAELLPPPLRFLESNGYTLSFLASLHEISMPHSSSRLCLVLS
ncbi:hypothetical protein L7F22_002301 [Adiantum nelumboides]|nr:hypothetical protein [Adiantum nelumboides]